MLAIFQNGFFFMVWLAQMHYLENWQSLSILLLSVHFRFATRRIVRTLVGRFKYKYKGLAKLRQLVCNFNTNERIHNMNGYIGWTNLKAYRFKGMRNTIASLARSIHIDCVTYIAKYTDTDVHVQYSALYIDTHVQCTQPNWVTWKRLHKLSLSLCNIT